MSKTPIPTTVQPQSLLLSKPDENVQKREIEKMVKKVVSERLECVVEALMKRKAAMRSHQTSVSDFEISAEDSSDESIQTVKRRKSTDIKPAADMVSAARPVIKQPVTVTPATLPSVQPTAAPANMLQFPLILSFIQVIHTVSSMIEYNVPPTFSIKAFHQGLYLPVHPTTQAGAYRSIFMSQSCYTNEPQRSHARK